MLFLMLIPQLFLIAFVNLKQFNVIIDWILPLYLIGVIIYAFYFVKSMKDENSECTAEYKYTPKKIRLNEPWKEAFVGKWEQVERIGLYEFLVFNGAPEFVASMMRNAGAGAIITLKGRIINVDLSGMPAMKGFDAPVAENKEKTIMVKTTTKGGFWWDYETHSLCVESIGPISKTVAIRTLIEPDLMLVKVKAWKSDLSEAHVKAMFKRIS